MFLHPDCAKYRQWKKEQAKKSKEGKKKSTTKRKKRITDCLDEEQNEDAETPTLKVNYRRCKKKRKKKKLTTHPSRVVFKQVSWSDMLIKRIKPTIEERERYLNRRHEPCVTDSATELDFASSRTATASFASSSMKKRRRVRVKKEPQATGTKRDDEKGDKDDEKKAEIKKEDERDDDKDDDKRKKMAKSKRMKKKEWRRRMEAKRLKELGSDSACSSVCSFDSEVCLADVKLTSKDREKIERYQRRSPEKKEAE